MSSIIFYFTLKPDIASPSMRLEFRVTTGKSALEVAKVSPFETYMLAPSYVTYHRKAYIETAKVGSNINVT